MSWKAIGLVIVGLLVGWYWFRTELLAIGIPLVIFELAVITSAVLDWREARLLVVGWRQAWVIAHATVFVRAYRRARHTLRGALAARARRDLRRHHEQTAPTTAVVILDPSVPFTGRVIDLDPNVASSDQADPDDRRRA